MLLLFAEIGWLVLNNCPGFHAPYEMVSERAVLRQLLQSLSPAFLCLVVSAETGIENLNHYSCKEAEQPRCFWRTDCLSQAAIADTAGGMLPIGCSGGQ